jgi:5,10-methylenetetrahydromethanopterin reductase
MSGLPRPVGLGLASHGELRAAARYADQASTAGLDSVWFHESYFERDAVTYATEVAGRVAGLRVGLGALNPNTRHPVLIAMTVSALDELAPGRIMLALGSALPLRLRQMGFDYDPDQAIAKVEQAIGDLRRLWGGERLPSPPGLPDVEPMFPPVHRVPIWVAGYRKAFHELAGRVADGSWPAPPSHCRRCAWGSAGSGRRSWRRAGPAARWRSAATCWPSPTPAGERP